jgi:hypothetical protein
MMWDRPRTLEELIPADVRERWGIDTQTRILWTKPTLYDAEQEISENNVIELRYKDGKLDNKLREYMKSQRVMTVHKMNDNLQILRNWAISHGKKIRLIQEK